jgi:hypothetical protein
MNNDGKYSNGAGMVRRQSLIAQKRDKTLKFYF